MRWILPLLVVLPTQRAATLPPSGACLAEVRSAEWLVATSPLVVIGEIETVAPGPTNNRIPDDSPQPSVATVKVLRVLKGGSSPTTLKIGSGPMRSCAPWPVHCRFTAGVKRLFLLPAWPGIEATALEWGGSNLPVDSLAMIESRIQRARTYREDYLADAKARDGAAYDRGIALAAELRKASLEWPEWDRRSDDAHKALAALVERLKAVEIEAIWVALAHDWLVSEHRIWWRRSLWTAAVAKLGDLRQTDVEKADRRWIARLCASLKVPEAEADRYLDSLEYREAIRFPVGPLYRGRDFKDDLVTVDFMVRCTAYDQGAMFVAYGMEFDILAHLDPARVGVQLEALYGSDDETLRIVALRAVQRVPGVNFVDMVHRRFWDDSSAWYALKHPTDAAQTAKRMAAFVKKAVDSEHPFWRAELWRRLRGEDCFETPCLEAAIDRVDGAVDEEGTAIHRYLRSAMESRDAQGAKSLSADDYRRWFKEHPPKTKD